MPFSEFTPDDLWHANVQGSLRRSATRKGEVPVTATPILRAHERAGRGWWMQLKRQGNREQGSKGGKGGGGEDGGGRGGSGRGREGKLGGMGNSRRHRLQRMKRRKKQNLILCFLPSLSGPRLSLGLFLFLFIIRTLSIDGSLVIDRSIAILPCCTGFVLGILLHCTIGALRLLL